MDQAMTQTVTWQRVEGAVVFAAGVILVLHEPAWLPWWARLLVFFAPDLGFVGYAFGPRRGSVFYNATHVYGLGAILIALGASLSLPICVAVGALWLAHAGLDRMLGYRLKSPEGFSVTHLGPIGKAVQG
jgi:hypothetical protein